MPIQTLNTIKSWFKTTLKPTQDQFWDTWDSFRHKFEKVPLKDVEDLEVTLNKKAEKSQMDAHQTDGNAHSELFAKKEDNVNKGVANGYVPLDDIAKIASQYLNIINDLVSGGSNSLLSAEQGVVLQNQIELINNLLKSDNPNLDTIQKIVDTIKEIQSVLKSILVNDLTTGGTTKALTAEMGKILQNQINAINTLLSSNDVNLDTLQEIVDAIKQVQNNLSTILVNDLTTGGVTKALTSEMGKLLQNNKVDKVAGKSLVSDTEINRLAGVSNVVIATDAETQITSAISEDNKVVSRSKLFNWWDWIKNYSAEQKIYSYWNFLSGIRMGDSYIKSDSSFKIGTDLLALSLGAGGIEEVIRIGPKVALFFKPIVLYGADGSFPPLIIPNSELTTIPQNGAIERDLNGELWETHDGIRSKIGVDVEVKGEFSNNRQALEANLKAGDFYSTPMENNKSIVCVVKPDLSLEKSITLIFNNMNDVITATNGGITDPSSLYQWNTYNTRNSGYCPFSSIRVSGNSITLVQTKVVDNPSLRLTNCGIVDVILHNLKLDRFDLDGNDIATTNFISTLPDGLTRISLSGNKLTNFDPPSPLPSSVWLLGLSNNKITNFNPTIPLSSGLEQIDLADNKLTSWGPLTHSLPNTLKILRLNNNLITNTFFESNPLPNSLYSLVLDYNKLTDMIKLPNENRISVLSLYNNNIEKMTIPINAPYLQYLYLNENKLSGNFLTGTFPKYLQGIYLTNNALTVDSWNNYVPNYLKDILYPGNIFIGNNDSIVGTETEALLLSKNWTIYNS